MGPEEWAPQSGSQTQEKWGPIGDLPSAGPLFLPDPSQMTPGSPNTPLGALSSKLDEHFHPRPRHPKTFSPTDIFIQKNVSSKISRRFNLGRFPRNPPPPRDHICPPQTRCPWTSLSHGPPFSRTSSSPDPRPPLPRPPFRRTSFSPLPLPNDNREPTRAIRVVHGRDPQPQFHETTLQERKKERKWGGRVKKAKNWAVWRRSTW